MSVRFSAETGLVIVRAELWGPAGSTILRMALDTGAVTTPVNADPMTWVGYDLAACSSRVQLTTGSGVEYAAKVTVQRMASLGLKREGFPIVCHTLPPSANVDGLLGLDFLRGQVLQLDFRLGEIVLE
ncbi:MAG: retropepsin-like domain-containing protein [Pirellulales bacterium]|nr:retropepsin-like domain-containing protein [Pirellulales bacterium]